MTVTGTSPNTHQGYFGEGMVASIAAAAGLDVQFPRLGKAVDLNVFWPGPNGTSGSKQVTLQVKTWSTGQLHSDNTFHYPLEVPAYNYLAGSGHDVRHYLVLCIVPSTPSDYADSSHERLHLRHAAYWHSLRNETPNLDLNSNSTKTIRVPKSQLLTADTLLELVAGDEAKAVVP